MATNQDNTSNITEIPETELTEEKNKEIVNTKLTEITEEEQAEQSNIREFLTMCLDILQDSTLDLCNLAYEKIVNKEIDSDLDMLLRTIGGIQPFQLIIPELREALGLAIVNDDSCIQQLTVIK